MYVCASLWLFCFWTALPAPVALLVRVCQVHRFSCLIWVNPSARSRNGARSQSSVSAFPNSKINLQSVFAPYHDADKMCAFEGRWRQVLWVLWAHLAWTRPAAAVGPGTNPVAANSKFPWEISSPWPSSYWEKRVYQQRAAAMCSHQVLWGSKINPKETWPEHIPLSLGFNEMESATSVGGTKSTGQRGRVCVAAKRCSFIR